MECHAKALTVTVLLFSLATIPFCSAWVYVPATEGFGFKNGSYLKFAEAMNLTICYQESGANTTYPNFWFLGNTRLYGFYSQNANVTVNTVFSNHLLNMTLNWANPATATTKIYIENLEQPSVSGASSWSYDSSSETVIIAVTNPNATQILISFETTLTSFSSSTPSPTLTPAPKATSQGPSPSPPTPSPSPSLFLSAPTPLFPKFPITIALQTIIAALLLIALTALFRWRTKEKPKKLT